MVQRVIKRMGDPAKDLAADNGGPSGQESWVTIRERADSIGEIIFEKNTFLIRTL